MLAAPSEMLAVLAVLATVNKQIKVTNRINREVNRVRGRIPSTQTTLLARYFLTLMFPSFSAE